MDSWSLAVVAGVIVAYAAVSRRLELSIVSAAMVFVTAGFIAGPDVLGWFDQKIESESVRVLAEATLTLVLFQDASRLDLGALRRELAVPVRLLAVGLPLTIVAGMLAAVGVLSQLLWVEALVLAVVLAPTDAALGQAVVTEERLPSRIRQGLNVESGLNDGICVPLLFIALAAAEVEASEETGSGAVRLVAEQIGYGVIGGVVGGVAAATVLLTAGRRGWIDGAWLQIVPVAGAALAYGVALGLDGSGFIAAFVGGGVYGVLRRRYADEAEHLLEEAGAALNGLTFLVFGAVLLVPAFEAVSAAGLVYA